MKNKPKRGQISSYQLFSIFVVSRVVVTLTYFISISLGELSADILISFGLGYLISLVLALPAYFAVVKKKNPLKSIPVSILYTLLFMYLAAVNISRFAYFSSSKIQPESSMVFVIILIFGNLNFVFFLYPIESSLSLSL